MNIPVFEEDTLTFVTVDLYYPKGKLFPPEFEGTSPPSQEAVPIMATPTSTRKLQTRFNTIEVKLGLDCSALCELPLVGGTGAMNSYAGRDNVIPHTKFLVHWARTLSRPQKGPYGYSSYGKHSIDC